MNEKKKLRLEHSQAMSDLWKLRSREKKLGEHKISQELRKIKELTEKNIKNSRNSQQRKKKN